MPNYNTIPGSSANLAGQIQSAGQNVPQPQGSNRYIPPTYNYGRGVGGQADYSSMNWNNVQGYQLPQQANNPYQQQYMQGLQGMLGRFGNQYGMRNPQMPQFREGDPYQMMFGGGGGPQMPQFGGGLSGFDPRMLMAMMYGGMSPNQMFGGFQGLGGLGGPNNTGGGQGGLGSTGLSYDQMFGNIGPQGSAERPRTVTPGKG